MTRPPTAAQALYGHLPSVEPAPPPRQQPASVAAAMYPSLIPKPSPPAPRPRLTREQAFDWSNVDPNYARMVGLMPKAK
jgi:hypothetical protein